MNKEIYIAYLQLEQVLKYQFNEKGVRNYIRHTLHNLLPDYYIITCDEINNPPDIIDKGEIVATIFNTKENKYMNLIFNDNNDFFKKQLLRSFKIKKIKESFVN